MTDFRIDDALLESGGLAPATAGGAACYRLAARLGGLARWLLRDEVLNRAAGYCEAVIGNPNEAAHLRTAPRLARAAGVCGVLFATDPPGHRPLLRDGFALPVRWERADGPAAGRDVPPGLAKEASEVLELLDAARDRAEPTTGRWRLRLAGDDRPDLYDLSGWTTVGGGSAWGILTAALLTASSHVASDPAVWASVGWDPTHRRLRPVGGLAAKYTAARHFGARALFVAQAPDGAGGVGGAEVRVLDDRHGHPLAALLPLRVALAARPAPLADYLAADPAEPDTARQGFFDDANRYHALLTTLGERGKAVSYYREELIGPIAERCRAQLAVGWPEAPRLVTVMSGAPELVELAVLVHRPVRVLILYTPETGPRREEEERRVKRAAGRACTVSFVPIGSDAVPGELSDESRAFARDGRPDDLVIDLTPGTKAITLASYADLAVPHSRPVYVHTARPDGSTIKYGTERLIFLSPPASPNRSPSG